MEVKHRWMLGTGNFCKKPAMNLVIGISQAAMCLIAIITEVEYNYIATEVEWVQAADSGDLEEEEIQL